MHTLILHVSDIHIESASDPIFKRATAVARAAARFVPGVHRALILVTGDVANRGMDDQYKAATELFSTIRKSLADDLSLDSSSVHVIALPGNHDCNLAPPQVLRDMVLSRIVSASDLREHEIGEVVTKPLAAFRTFSKNLRLAKLEPEPTFENNLRTTYAIGAIPEQLIIHCYNTPAMSRLNEVPGTLLFPGDEVADSEPDRYTLVVSMFHHPHNWLQPDNARSFRTSVERTSDLILTGHEHHAASRQISARSGEVFTHIEGAVLQDRGNQGHSGFNVLVVDSQNRKHAFSEYRLEQKIYVSDLEEDAEIQWTDLPLNRLRTRGSFPYSEQHAAYLDDPELQLTHRQLGSLRLNDVFVYPDLQEIISSATRPSQTLRGEVVLERMASRDRVFIVGDQSSGKTALAKMICVDLHSRGELPLFLKGSPSVIPGGKLRQTLNHEIGDQYDRSLVAQFDQADKNRKVVVVDDFDRCGRSPEGRQKLVGELESMFGKVILLSDDMTVGMSDLLAPQYQEYDKFRILPFGYLRRNELVDRWLAKHPPETAAALARRAVEISKTLDHLFGRGAVPPYPIYILAILQASEASTPIDSNISTHGYYYELLINAELVRGATNKETDVLTGYLGFMASKYFSEGTEEMSVSRYVAFHDEYEAKYDMRIDSDKILDTLCSRNMLRKVNDLVRFRYKYVYYYFIASYLRDHLQEEESKEVVRRLVGKVYRRENADILLFLAHVTKDSFVVSTLLDAARSHYSDVERVGDVSEVSVPEPLQEALEKVAYEEQAAHENRREMAKVRDGLRDTIPDHNTDEWTETFEPLKKLMAALHTMQIVGQVLKNYPGRLDAETKLSLADAGYGIGARAWRVAFNELVDNRQEIARELVDAIRRHDPSLGPSVVNDRAQGVVTALSHLCGMGVVKRMADALGAAELSPTYEKLVASEKGSDAVRLTRIAIQMEVDQTTPEGEIKSVHAAVKHAPLASWILQQLTVEHFRLFHVEPSTKQRVCEALGIEYKSGLASGNRPKRIGPLNKKSGG